MAMTAVDVDDESPDLARQILGTRTKKDTINAALREVIRVRAAVDLIHILGDDRQGHRAADAMGRAGGKRVLRRRRNPQRRHRTLARGAGVAEFGRRAALRTPCLRA